MNKRVVSYLQYLFFIALASLFVWLSLRNLDAQGWDRLKDAFAQARYWVLLPVLLLLLASHWIRALRWKMLMEPLGYKPTDLNTFFGVMIGYFVNLGAPRLGEILKCTILARYEKVPADKLVGTIVAERAFDLISLLVVFAITLLTQFDTVGAFAMDKVRPLITSKEGGFSVNKLLIIAGIAIAGILLLRLIFTRFLHLNFIKKLKGIVQGVLGGLSSVRYVKNKALFLFYSVMIWALYLASTWLGFWVLEETAHMGIGAGFSVLSMGSIAMILSPGGIGAYPLAVQSTVALYGIAEEPYGQALGWLLWSGQFVIFVVFGVLSFIMLPIVNKKKQQQHAQA